MIYAALVMVLGAVIIQDGVASICFYQKRETWKRNHSWRLFRIGVGIALMVAGVKLLEV